MKSDQTVMALIPNPNDIDDNQIIQIVILNIGPAMNWNNVKDVINIGDDAEMGYSYDVLLCEDNNDNAPIESVPSVDELCGNDNETEDRSNNAQRQKGNEEVELQQIGFEANEKDAMQCGDTSLVPQSLMLTLIIKISCLINLCRYIKSIK